jgi:hypothetical protein
VLAEKLRPPILESWSGVTIDWDDGHTTSILHNDMAQVERVPRS